MKTDILYFDHEKNTWDFGDVTGFDINQPLMLPENASMVPLDNSQCEHSDVFITGGIDKYNNVLNWTMGLSFAKENEKSLLCQMSLSNNDMILPEGRMMHGSCIVKNAKDEPRLLVFGGKTGNSID